MVLTQGGDDALRAPLRDTGLQVIAGPSRRTTVYAVSLHGDGTWHESISALGDAFTPHDVVTWMAPALEQCSAVVCGSLWRGDFPPATLEALRTGRAVYLDGQGPGRAPRLGPVLVDGPLQPALIQGVRVLKVSEHEARALFGAIDVASAESTDAERDPGRHEEPPDPVVRAFGGDDGPDRDADDVGDDRRAPFA